MRAWSVEIYIEGPDGSNLPANMFDSVTYNLHPTFPKPTQGTCELGINAVEMTFRASTLEANASDCSLQEAAVPHPRRGLG